MYKNNSKNIPDGICDIPENETHIIPHANETKPNGYVVRFKSGREFTYSKYEIIAAAIVARKRRASLYKIGVNGVRYHENPNHILSEKGL